MNNPRYNRSEVLNYFDLPEELQTEVYQDYSSDDFDIESEQYVIFEYVNSQRAIPLSMFMRVNQFGSAIKCRWHGYFTTSNSSSFVIRFNRSADEALIALL